jgi:hypothetical protein
MDRITVLEAGWPEISADGRAAIALGHHHQILYHLARDSLLEGKTMVVTIGPDLEAALKEQAQRRGVAPEELALIALRDRFLASTSLQPRDEWERGLLEAATDCGVSLPDEALSREELYD